MNVLMEDSALISQRLLIDKERLQNQANPTILNKLWKSFKSDTKEYIQSQKDLNNCLSSKSKWVLRRTPDINKYYDISTEMTGGPGGTAKCYKGRDIMNGKIVGVKVIDKKLVWNEFQRSKFYQSIRTETYLLWKLFEHPNIVSYHTIFETEKYVQVVMDYCDGGELFDKICLYGKIPESLCAYYLRQICSAVYYIHSRGVVHCDLKPENILIKIENGKEVIKLIDFGLSQINKEGSYLTDKAGTIMYMSPEQIDGKYDETADMWSIGVILYTMIYGYSPWYTPRDGIFHSPALIKKIKMGFNSNLFPREPKVSNKVRHLIEKLLKYHVGNRLTASETLEHPFLINAVEDNSDVVIFANPEVNNSINNVSKASVSSLQTEAVNILKHRGYLRKYQEKAIIRFFNAADTDNDGCLSYDEVYNALKLVDNSATKEYVIELCKGCDVNNDGNICIDELIRIRILQKLNNRQERKELLFDLFDLNNDGQLSKNELEHVLLNYFREINQNFDTNDIQNKVNKIIQETDLDGDGYINCDEFLRKFKIE